MDGEPRWRTFTSVVVAAGIALLWSAGVPGSGFGIEFGGTLFLVAVVVLAVTGVLWLLRLIRACRCVPFWCPMVFGRAEWCFRTC